jgi:rhamnosyltransferase subunit A
VLFINGELDEYTTTEDVRSIARHIRYSQFAVIPDAGHFLDLESTQARRTTGEIKRRFLLERDPGVEIGSIGNQVLPLAV